MRLKRIKIVGFKSFADPTVLEFHEGITGIVGPNGCGKSNISDAFKWVFGESSAQALRGKKSEDFIFSGTATRKPLNYAEVVLTLADAAGTLPLPYDEIEVARRCYRDGSSEYFINRQLVRRMDLLDLFLDSGIGKNATSMVFEQGETDKLIRFSPHERRSLFEEAAGTQRFRLRREEAMRKLSKTENNMAPLREVHKEVQKQLATLKKQAEEAESFKGKKEELEELLKGIYSAKWKLAEEKGASLSEKQGGLHAEKALLDGELGQLSHEQQQMKGILQESEALLRKYNEEVYKVRSDKEIRNRERQTADERLRESKEKEERWRQELGKIAEKQQEGEKAIAEALARKKELEKEAEAAESVMVKQREKVHTLEKELSTLRHEQRQSQQQRLEKAQRESVLDGEIKQCNVRLEGSRERMQEGKKRAGLLSAELHNHQKAVKERQKEVDTITASVDKQKLHLQQLEGKQQLIVEELARMEEQFDLLQHEQAQAVARLHALRRLQEEMEGLSSGSKRLLQEAADKKSRLYGLVKPLYTLIEAKEGGSEALSAVLRSYAETLVAQSEEDFEKVVAFAKKEKLKDFSLLCLDRLLKRKKGKAPKGLAPFLEKAASGPLAEQLFDQIYAVNDSAAAFALVEEHHGSQAWIADGGFLDSRGVLFYTAQGENNLFVREAEIRTLEVKTAHYEKQKEELDAAIEKRQEGRAAIQGERAEADREIRRSEMRLIESNFSLQKALSDSAKSEEELGSVSREQQLLEEGIRAFEEKLQKLQADHKVAVREAQEVEKRAAALTLTLSKNEPTLEEEQRRLVQLQHTSASLRGELARLNHQLQLLELQKSERQERGRQLEEERSSNRQLQEQFKEKGDSFAKSLAEVEQNLSGAMKRCAEFESSVEKQRKEIEKGEAAIGKLQGKLKKVEEEANKLNIAAAQLDVTRTTLGDELQERFQITPAQLLELDIALALPIDEAEKAMRTLRRDVEKAQETINMASIDELAQQQERDQYLHTQIEDLSGSKEELLEIIAQLDIECRTLFDATFQMVRENFKRNFAILFNGGEADLQLEGGSDLLEAGVEIIAKPPGKKMRSINLLSGGEKCMTAVALLFALFEVKPAPFCILDEIDAPLDDSNVERFLNVVRQFIDRCQFIIITHNKRTMAICDRLFGVSMEEKGVSKLLSIEFTREGAVKPALVEHAPLS